MANIFISLMANIINDCGARFKDPVLPVAWSEPAVDVERFGCLKPPKVAISMGKIISTLWGFRWILGFQLLLPIFFETL
jgi:hypothetical protein